MLSSLDREKKDHYILTALAKDNPGDVASNRRENSVQVRGAAWGSKQHCRGDRCEQKQPPSPLGDVLARRRDQEAAWMGYSGCDLGRKGFWEDSLCATLLRRQLNTPGCDAGKAWCSVCPSVCRVSYQKEQSSNQAQL